MLILKKQPKISFEKFFFNLINDSVFGKFMENFQKHRDIKFVTCKRKEKKTIWCQNQMIILQKFFTEYLLAKDMKNITQILMNKPKHFRQSILQLSKTITYEFWYYYVKPKYGQKAKLCYIDIDSLMVNVKQVIKSFQKMLKKV